MSKTSKYNYLDVGIVACIIFVAIVLRLPGYDGRMLWNDELWRINLILMQDIYIRLFTLPDIYTSTTAPIYIVLNRLIALFTLAPFNLRLSSYVPGVLSPVLAYLIIWKLANRRLAAIGCAIAFALNADLIYFSKEFKPYAFEVLCHLICFYFWINLIASKVIKPAKIWALFLAMMFLIFCGANSVFLFPAICISSAVFLFREDRKFLGLAFGLLLVVLGMTLMMFYFNWAYGKQKDLLAFWSTSFYDPATNSYLSYLIRKSIDTWNSSFSLFSSRDYIRSGIFYCLLVTIFILARQAMRGISSKLLSVIVYYLFFFVTVIVLNRMNFWPLGSIRTNSFIYIQVILMVFSLIALIGSKRLYLLLICVVLCLEFSVAPTIHRSHLMEMTSKAHRTDLVWAQFKLGGEPYSKIKELCQKGGSNIFLNLEMAGARDFLSKQDRHSETGPSAIDGECVMIQIIATDVMGTSYPDVNKLLVDINGHTKPSWFLYGGLHGKDLELTKFNFSRFGVLSEVNDFEGAGYFLVSPNK